MDNFDHEICMNCKYFKEEFAIQSKHTYVGSDLAIDMLLCAHDCFKSDKEDGLKKTRPKKE